MVLLKETSNIYESFAELKNKSYIERLKMCNLPTLHFRRIRGDMIEVFKILTGKYDTAAAPVMDIYDLKTTRGNDFKLNKIRAKYDTQILLH